MISICMLKICGDSITKPLDFTFKSCIESGKFPTEWKKAIVVPGHKKIKNYRKQSSDFVAVCLW